MSPFEIPSQCAHCSQKLFKSIFVKHFLKPTEHYVRTMLGQCVQCPFISGQFNGIIRFIAWQDYLLDMYL